MTGRWWESGELYRYVAGTGLNIGGFGFSVSLFSVSDVLLVLEVIVLVDSVSISKVVSLSVILSVVRSTII